MDSFDALIDSKNTWLKELVAVEFPTPESVEGAKLYLTKASEAQCLALDDITSESEIDIDALYRVDFHRLTIMYSQLHAKRWQGRDAELVLEFLTQIILEPDYEIYVGFKAQIPVFGFMLSSTTEGDVLISDTVYCPHNESQPASPQQIKYFVTHFQDHAAFEHSLFRLNSNYLFAECMSLN